MSASEGTTWVIADHDMAEKTAFEYLKEYAEKLSDDSKGVFEGDVTQILAPDGSFSYSLYLIVPELKNYSYKLIEVFQESFNQPYPVDMVLYNTKQDQNDQEFFVEEHEFEDKLLRLITSPITQQILRSLQKQVEIFKRYGVV
jgi:hypothetical protein